MNDNDIVCDDALQVAPPAPPQFRFPIVGRRVKTPGSLGQPQIELPVCTVISGPPHDPTETTLPLIVQFPDPPVLKAFAIAGTLVLLVRLREKLLLELVITILSYVPVSDARNVSQANPCGEDAERVPAGNV